MNSAKHLPPEALDEWLQAAASELGLDPTEVDIATVLNVARDVAHQVARPAAPLSTFLLGLAVGQGRGTLSEKAQRLTDLAMGWDEQN